MNPAALKTSLVLSLLFLLPLCLTAAAQKPELDEPKPVEPNVEAPKIPEIKDEPKTIDPAKFMPKALQKKVTVDLSKSSLSELVKWLQEEQKISAVLNERDLDDMGMLPGDPISDQLKEMPVYMVLNRLNKIGLAWYVEGGIVHVTTASENENHLNTLTYPVGHLLDADFDKDSITEVVTYTIEPDSWEELGGPGVVSFLGDVMLVRQTDEIHRKVKGLLEALVNHGRRTFISDTPTHASLREKLEQNISVNFEDTPLAKAVDSLGLKAKIDMRLDLIALAEVGLRERVPVSLALNETKLKTVLNALLQELDLTYTLQDGVLWITTHESAESFLKTAVFDVRDLCRDNAESDGLANAITTQASPESWDQLGGPGSLQFAKPGTLVISHQEEMLDEVLLLLTTYRNALKMSKPREPEGDDPKEVIDVYYKMDTSVAMELQIVLLKLVKPESWKNDKQPEAPGEILRISSSPNVVSAKTKNKSPEPNSAFLVNQSVLLIKQSRENHQEIQKVINRILDGDPKYVTPGAGGMGGGGFGGGYFSVPKQKVKP